MSARALASTLPVLVLFAASACGPPPGGVRAPATADRASLSGPSALARFGSALYVVDMGGRAVRRLDLSSGRLSTVVTREPLENPFDVAIEPDGGLALVDGSRLARVAPDGRVSVLATWKEVQEASDGGGLVTAVASAPQAVFAAAHDYVVRIDRATRAITRVLASDGDEQFTDVAADRDGHLYVAEAGTFAGNHRIRRVDAVTGEVTRLVGPATPIAGAPAARQSRVKGPHNLALDDRGGLVFCDATRILRLDLASGEVRLLSTHRAEDGGWASLAVGEDRALLVADYTANRIRRIDLPSGRMRAIAGRGGPIAAIGVHAESAGYPDPADEACSEGQTDARIQVSAVDASGAGLPGALVRLVPEEEGVPISAITRGDGRAALVAPSGDYVVLATMPGFQPASAAVRLSAGCTGRVALKLPLGSMSYER